MPSLVTQELGRTLGTKKYLFGVFVRHAFESQEIMLTTSPSRRWNMEMILVSMDRSRFVVLHLRSTFVFAPLDGAAAECWIINYVFCSSGATQFSKFGQNRGISAIFPPFTYPVHTFRPISLPTLPLLPILFSPVSSTLIPYPAFASPFRFFSDPLSTIPLSLFPSRPISSPLSFSTLYFPHRFSSRLLIQLGCLAATGMWNLWSVAGYLSFSLCNGFWHCLRFLVYVIFNPLFTKGCCHGNQFLRAKSVIIGLYSPLFVALASRNGLQYRHWDVKTFIRDDLLHYV